MLERNELKKLFNAVAHANSSAPVAYSFNGKDYSYEQLNNALRAELKEYAGCSYRSYRENKNLIFGLIEETLDDILPAKVEDFYANFAEIKTFAQGDKPIFRRKVSSRMRAKQFITRVGLAGRYEVFKLGGVESFEVPTSAIGGACQVSIEEFLDGVVDWNELVQIVMEGMDELIAQEVAKAMVAATNQLPGVNYVNASGFVENNFDRLIAIASAYGTPTIYCTYDFAVKMIPSKQWMYSNEMKNELWNNGRFTNYKGTNVVIIPNGFTDETNAKRVIDPSYAWIIPSGGDNKPVKIAFEGGTMLRESDNEDWSKELQVYRKVGVVALMTNNICVYHDTALADLGLATTAGLYGEQLGTINP